MLHVERAHIVPGDIKALPDIPTIAELRCCCAELRRPSIWKVFARAQRRFWVPFSVLILEKTPPAPDFQHRNADTSSAHPLLGVYRMLRYQTTL